MVEGQVGGAKCVLAHESSEHWCILERGLCSQLAALIVASEVARAPRAHLRISHEVVFQDEGVMRCHKKRSATVVHWHWHWL